MTHLRYNMYPSPNEHPQKVMKNLGIKYQYAVPQSIGDQWWFFNCEKIPDPLPEYLELLTDLEGKMLDPFELIGYGLDKEMAEKIRDFEIKHIEK